MVYSRARPRGLRAAGSTINSCWVRGNPGRTTPQDFGLSLAARLLCALWNAVAIGRYRRATCTRRWVPGVTGVYLDLRSSAVSPGYSWLVMCSAMSRPGY